MHYVSNDWQLEELLIDFRGLIGNHSGVNMAHTVYETLKLYGLRGRVVAINCNNASNNDTWRMN
ncbi:hypothetical protein PILCRDRAFT_745898 [Piloderma croceum F 1598]|uniref:Uncharacterized protein n=1 Tax=Piloderma croceum (strain F 1598) TaxID=765440 RepID=A0A0C3AED6_PILCF|nr:hypothetical protein PILCRDRAFT_745898 [Piloderma croceum F 1598]